MRHGAHRKARVFIAVGVVLIVAAGILWGDTILQRAAHGFTRLGSPTLSTLAYSTLFKAFPQSEHAPEALFRVAQSLPPWTSPTGRGLFPGLNFSESLPPGTMQVEGTTIFGPGRAVPTHQDFKEESERKLAYLRQVIEMNPGPPWDELATIHLGLTLVELRQYREAVHVLESLSDRRPLFVPEVSSMLANIYEGLGEWEAAEALLRRKLGDFDDGVLGNQTAFAYRLALSLEKQNRLEEALELYTVLADTESLATHNRELLGERVEQLRTLSSDTSVGIVSGHVILNGRGLAGIQVSKATLRKIPADGIALQKGLRVESRIKQVSF